jgi:hypothetical protein
MRNASSKGARKLRSELTPSPIKPGNSQRPFTVGACEQQNHDRQGKHQQQCAVGAGA